MDKIVIVPKVPVGDINEKHILSEENQKYVADWPKYELAWAKSFGKMIYDLELNEFLDFIKTWKPAKGFPRKHD